MKTRLFSAAALLTTLASTQGASAALPSSSTLPRPVTESIGSYAAVELDPALGPALDAHLAAVVNQLAVPAHVSRGAVLEVARYGTVVYANHLGQLHGSTAKQIEEAGLSDDSMVANAIFDLESMTKVTTMALILRLADLGHINLADPVINYIPEFAYSHSYDAGTGFTSWVDADADGVPDLDLDPAKADVTVLDLLAFRGGVSIDTPGFDPVYGSADPWATMAHVPLDYAPRTTQLYSDMSYRLLGHIAEVAMQAPLHHLVRTYVTAPFGMTDTDFEPSVYMSGNTVSFATGAGSAAVPTINKLDRVAGTGTSSFGVRPYAFAEVQDDNDHWAARHNVITNDKYGNPISPIHVGTTSAPSGIGCDGIFSTARDFLKLGQIFLNRGKRVDPAPVGMACVRAPCWVTTPLLSPANVAGSIAAPAPTATFTPLIPSASYPVATSFGQNLIHSRKGWGWELPDGGAFSPGGQLSFTNAVTKTGGAGTFIKVDFDADTVAVLMTNHGLPDFSTIAAAPMSDAPYYMITWSSFDDMLTEAGIAQVNDLVTSNIACVGCM